jgi:2-oxoglutarate dehydrogenase E2 component (dihydrolipoamide succinyltransferase)
MAIVELILPKMGESIMEATIIQWHKKVGDTIKEEEILVDVATDKVDSEVPSIASGVIKEIFFKVNDVVPVGSVIAAIETESEQNTFAEENPPHSIEQLFNLQETPSTPAFEANKSAIEETVPYVPAETKAVHSSSNQNRFYSPLVLNIARSENISLQELESVEGTGNEGRVTKNDMLAYIKNGKKNSAPATVTVQTPLQISQAQIQAQLEPKPSIQHTPLKETIIPAGYEDGATEIIEMDRMRKLIAHHMVASKQTSAHVTSFNEADVTNMVMWREKNKSNFEKIEKTKLTYTPMFIECLIRVIKRYPILNSSVDGEKIILKNFINMGMATALPNKNLIVPVIKNAGEMNLAALAKSVNNLANAARNNKLKPDDTQNGTFTLTNVGTFGSLMGTPIIHQPQVAILAVGVIKKRPVVIESDKGDYIGIRHMMYLSLSYDHRIIDGSVGAAFLSETANEFEKWDVNRNW